MKTLKIGVGKHDYYFKTSYNKDVGLAPLEIRDNLFYAGTNRPFDTIARDLDDLIADDKSLRGQIGGMIKEARDNSSTGWGESKPKKEIRPSLRTAIAELGVIFRLDLARAGKLSAKALAHQDALLDDCDLSFKKLLMKKYIGIKAASLRDKSAYKQSKY